MSNFGNNQPFRGGNHGHSNIVTNDNDDFVRDPRPGHPVNPNIITNDADDFVRVPGDQKFQIFIRNFADSKTYTFEVLDSYTVDQLMGMVQSKLNIAKEQQRLVYAGKNLKREDVLSHFDIRKGSTLDLLGRLRGG